MSSLVLVLLYARDLARAEAFYREMLGLERVAQLSSDTFIFLKPEHGTPLALQPVSEMPALKWQNRPKVGAEWILRKTGPAATNHFEGGGFVRGNDVVEWPNLMFHFLPLAIRYDGSKPAADHGYQVHIGPMTSDCRGTVKIGSTDPRRHAELRFNYLSTETDRK